MEQETQPTVAQQQFVNLVVRLTELAGIAKEQNNTQLTINQDGVDPSLVLDLNPEFWKVTVQASQNTPGHILIAENIENPRITISSF